MNAKKHTSKFTREKTGVEALRDPKKKNRIDKVQVLETMAKNSMKKHLQKRHALLQEMPSLKKGKGRSI